MSKLPLLSAKEFFKILVKLEFKMLKQGRGSHVFFRHPDGRTTTVPNHPGEKLDRGLLIKIIKRDLRLTRGEFMNLL